MKKVAFLLLLLLLLIPLIASAQQREFTCGITGTDTMYIWNPFKAKGTTLIQFDFTSFGATDSCQVDLYYLLKDEDSGQYIPLQIEVDASIDEIPLWLSKNIAAYQKTANGVNVADTTNSVAVKINDFIGEALGIKVIKYSAEADDTIKVRPRR